MRGGGSPPRLLELAIASERARDSERASEAEGRLKGGSGGALAPPALRGVWGAAAPQLMRAPFGKRGAHGVPKGPTLGGPRGAQGAHEGGPWGAQRAHLGDPRGAQGAHLGANTFPGKEILPGKNWHFPGKLVVPGNPVRTAR